MTTKRTKVKLLIEFANSTTAVLSCQKVNQDRICSSTLGLQKIEVYRFNGDILLEWLSLETTPIHIFIEQKAFSLFPKLIWLSTFEENKGKAKNKDASNVDYFCNLCLQILFSGMMNFERFLFFVKYFSTSKNRLNTKIYTSMIIIRKWNVKNNNFALES